MHLTSAELVLALDRIGIVVFAFSGVELGARRRFDLFGLLVMGTVTATGGGALRDIALGRVPFVLAHADYVAWALGASGVAIVLAWTNRTIPRPVLAVADAAGLGAFAVAGALAGIQRELPVTAVILLGILTATGGGVMRDLFADRVPLVLRTEVNATAAGLGALATWAIEPASNGGAALAGVGVTAVVRLASLAFDIHLPVPGREPPEP